MMKREVVRTILGAGVRTIGLTWENQWIRGIVTERRNTPHNQSHRRHVARTGNDQTVAAASEHMPRMSTNIHLSRQTAPAAVGRRRNRWYVYTYLQLRSEEQMNR